MRSAMPARRRAPALAPSLALAVPAGAVAIALAVSGLGATAASAVQPRKADIPHATLSKAEVKQVVGYKQAPAKTATQVTNGVKEADVAYAPKAGNEFHIFVTAALKGSPASLRTELALQSQGTNVVSSTWNARTQRGHGVFTGVIAVPADQAKPDGDKVTLKVALSTYQQKKNGVIASVIVSPGASLKSARNRAVEASRILARKNGIKY